MSNTSNNADQYNLPVNSTNDRQTLEQMRRGLCQEADGLKRQLDGKRQQIAACDRLLGKAKDRG